MSRVKGKPPFVHRVGPGNLSENVSMFKKLKALLCALFILVFLLLMEFSLLKILRQYNLVLKNCMIADSKTQFCKSLLFL